MILIGAILVGGLAALLTLKYVRGVENESAANNQMVEVLVASGAIPRGISADEALTKKVIVPANRRRADLPVNAVTRPADISGQITSLELAGGEILTTSMFVSPEERTGSNSSVIDRGNVAVTIRVDEESGVADLIRVGDTINIMARTKPAGEETEGSEMATVSGDQWRIANPYVTVFQNVKVVAISNIVDAPSAPAAAASGEDGESAPPPVQTSNGLVTVQLPADQAQLLASVQDMGLYLTLNRPDYEPVPIPYMSDFPPFSGQLGTTPYPTSLDEAKGQ